MCSGKSLGGKAVPNLNKTTSNIPENSSEIGRHIRNCPETWTFIYKLTIKGIENSVIVYLPSRSSKPV